MKFRTWGEYNRAQTRRRRALAADGAALAREATARRARLGDSTESAKLLHERIARECAEQDGETTTKEPK